MKWMRISLILVSIVLASCGKNDGIRTAGVGGPYPSPMGPSAPYPTGPTGYGPNPGYFPSGGFSGYPMGGMFQPYLPAGYPAQFYPWVPIYWYFQQYVYLQPVFMTIWNGWQTYAFIQQIPVYSFSQFWFSYLPQVISPQLYQYFSSQFYPWMNPNLVFPASYSPQMFWQNYNGIPFRLVCTYDC
ncbi:hypothetical protein EBQ90_10360 [bacterium]|nr:hypothetical protein [bacterium]